MKAELTRAAIDNHVPKTFFKGKAENFELQHIYREIEEFERLAEIGLACEEKEKAKKPIDRPEGWFCPGCNSRVHHDSIFMYCSRCGQLITWAGV